MLARSAAAGIAISLWLVLFRVVLGLSCVIDAGFTLGLFRWTSANPERLVPMPQNFGSAAVELMAGLLLVPGVSSRICVAALAVQLATAAGLGWLHTRVSPIDTPGFLWAAVSLTVLGVMGPGKFSVDAWRPRLLPKLLLRLRS